MSIADGQQLAQVSQAWEQRRVRLNLALVLAGVLVLGWGLVRLAPEVECACGYQGRRSDFASGHCPHCGRRFYAPPSVLRRLYSLLAPVCQSCGRRFWPWRRREVQRYPQGYALWSELPHDAAALPQRARQPRPTYVHRICRACQARSQQVHAGLRAEMLGRLQADRADLEGPYRRWLQACPPLPEAWPEPGREVFEIDSLSEPEALDEFLLAALDTRYFAWMERHASFAYSPPAGANLLDHPPAACGGIIHKTVYLSGVELLLTGSVYRRRDGQIVIAWEE